MENKLTRQIRKALNTQTNKAPNINHWTGVCGWRLPSRPSRINLIYCKTPSHRGIIGAAPLKKFELWGPVPWTWGTGGRCLLALMSHVVIFRVSRINCFCVKFDELKTVISVLPRPLSWAIMLRRPAKFSSYSYNGWSVEIAAIFRRWGPAS